jgi:hypothetical protein
MNVLAAAAAIVIALTGHALAWGAEGHRLVGSVSAEDDRGRILSAVPPHFFGRSKPPLQVNTQGRRYRLHPQRRVHAKAGSRVAAAVHKGDQAGTDRRDVKSVRVSAAAEFAR